MKVTRYPHRVSVSLSLNEYAALVAATRRGINILPADEPTPAVRRVMSQPRWLAGDPLIPDV